MQIQSDWRWWRPGPPWLSRWLDKPVRAAGTRTALVAQACDDGDPTRTLHQSTAAERLCGARLGHDVSADSGDGDIVCLGGRRTAHRGAEGDGEQAALADVERGGGRAREVRVHGSVRLAQVPHVDLAVVARGHEVAAAGVVCECAYRAEMRLDGDGGLREVGRPERHAAACVAERDNRRRGVLPQHAQLAEARPVLRHNRAGARVLVRQHACTRRAPCA